MPDSARENASPHRREAVAATSSRATSSRAFTLQLIALSLTKLGDAITSSRLVLAWMLAALGAPVVFMAMLVPIRESLSLLPQLLVAELMRRQPLRKGFWVAGSVGQALALLGMVAAVLMLRGLALGLAVVSLLALFSLARGVCSVAVKEVMGKTIVKSRRGRLSGLAASVAGMFTLAIAAALIWAPVFLDDARFIASEPVLFASILAVAAVLWLVAALVFAGVPEAPSIVVPARGSLLTNALGSLGLLASDAALRQFILARMLLVATAFAIPYIVVVIQRAAVDAAVTFGGLLLAEGAAGMLSGAFWGRWSDRAAHQVMAAAAGLSVAVILVAVGLHSWAPAQLASVWVAAAILFGAAVAHQGARVGRQTYLVDMASDHNRARYTAVSNTVMGLFLLSGALLGLVDTVMGTDTVLLLLAVVGVLAAWRCSSLPVVSTDPRA